MPRAIHVIYEDGVFKPLEKVSVKEHEKMTIIIANRAKCESAGEGTLAGIVGIAADCSDTDLSIRHDKYLYGDVAD